MSRTVKGRDFMSDAMFGNAASRPTVAQILALSQSSASIPSPNTWEHFGGAPGNEIAADGLSRAVGAYIHTAGTSTSTLQHTFTHTGPSGGGTAYTVRLVAVYAQANGGTIPGAADSGIPVFITEEPNPPTLVGTDSLNQTMSIDFGPA